MMTRTIRSSRYYSLMAMMALSTFLQPTEGLSNKCAAIRPNLAKDCHSLLDAHKHGISVRKTKTKGLGAFLGAGSETIQAGEWVSEYEGEILSRTEVEARYWDKRKCKTADRRWKKSRKQRQQGMSGDYIFDMGDDLFLDGEDSDVSSWCRFMNHAPEMSKDGETNNKRCNVETKCSRLSVDDSNVDEERVMPRLWFVARRDIACGEELLYDYGDSYWSES